MISGCRRLLYIADRSHFVVRGLQRHTLAGRGVAPMGAVQPVDAQRRWVTGTKHDVEPPTNSQIKDGPTEALPSDGVSDARVEESGASSGNRVTLTLSEMRAGMRQGIHMTDGEEKSFEPPQWKVRQMEREAEKYDGPWAAAARSSDGHHPVSAGGAEAAPATRDQAGTDQPASSNVCDDANGHVDGGDQPQKQEDPWENCDTVEEMVNEDRWTSPEVRQEHVTLAFKAFFYGTVLAIIGFGTTVVGGFWYCGFTSLADVLSWLQNHDQRTVEKLKAGMGKDDELLEYTLDLSNPAQVAEQVGDLMQTLSRIAEEQEAASDEPQEASA